MTLEKRKGTALCGMKVMVNVDQMKFLLKENGIKELSFYSDNCAGQNRNRFIYSMWEYAAYSLKVNIMHTFLEKGHTQNEGDNFLDFKPLVDNPGLNWKMSTDNDIIKWNNVKKNRGRRTAYCTPKNAYTENIPIDKLKLKDLLSLCDKGLIPTMYHDFYHSLVTA
ncbi:Uncharacterized protein FWK35_00014280 [Aphis craccivora]|uniref:Uncharacterized protein n=1 Tax=Aphis craccivora TaxID=307492 RepID=A0A6G0YC19_APHCR|nr:Uncharacterized protein FWK35_00014280 [Aphis craccivora]